MKSYRHLTLTLGGAAILFSGLVFQMLATSASSAEPLPSDDNLAPDFALEAMDGATIRLSDFQGQIVILNFWATWCPPCRYEIPSFITLQEEYADDVTFIGVSLDERGWDAVRPFAEELGINYPIVLDDGRVSSEYGGADVLPTTFLIDREGRIEVYAPGMLREAELRQILEMMLERGA